MRKAIEGNHLKKGWVTVDKKTKEEKPATGTMMLLPAKEGTCEQCATAHEPNLPHNQQSLFYQYAFYNKHGRWPTWADAMAHCSEDMKNHWNRELIRLGVEVYK